MAEAVMVRKSFLKKLIERGKEAAPIIVERTRQAGRRATSLVKRGAHAVEGKLASDRNGLFSLALGGLVAYVTSLDSVKKSDFLKKHWYVAPLVMTLLGYWMVRRGKAYGKALMTLGGMLFVQAYQNRPKDTDKKEGDKKEADKKETSGPEWQQLAAPYGARWVVTADGRQILVPARQFQNYERGALPPRRETADAVAQTADEIYGRTS